MPATTAPGAAGRLYDHAKLRAWRDEAGLTREQVCVGVGDLSAYHLGQLEGGSRVPSLQLLTRLAEFYGHPPGELLPGIAA